MHIYIFFRNFAPQIRAKDNKMMKRLLSLFVAILATTALWAYDFKYGDLYYKITSSSYPHTVEVTYEVAPTNNNYHNLQTANIPPQVSNNGITYNVTSIGESAFDDYDFLTSIVVPNSVTTIGDSAFYGCSSLTSIVIPKSVTSIGDYAFFSCHSLTSITIPNSITSIGKGAFEACSSLTSIVIPNSVTSIGDDVFGLCLSLTSIVIPNSVTSIGNFAFGVCSSLTSIIIPNSVISIGSEAFVGCSSLISIVIPNNVTSIGWRAFANCKSLKKINYAGTETQWNNIIKGDGWKDGTPATIICSAKSATPSRSNIHNGHEYVDLGLSVKWATCNVGANKPEEYGDYFAWGEVKPKEVYDWSTYKWCNGSEESLTKYDGYFDISFDISFELELSDDVAHTNWGGDWRMPTAEDFIELIGQCTWTRATLNGVKGRKVTGPNGNSIFLPDAGSRKGDWCGGKIGAYWSSWPTTIGVESNGSEAYHLHWLPLELVELDGDGKYIDPLDRCVGCSVRPVCP